MSYVLIPLLLALYAGYIVVVNIELVHVAMFVLLILFSCFF